MIEGLAVRIGPEAVVVVAAQPLRVLSSAVHNGGFASARAVVNLHVGKDDPCADPPAMLAAYARRAGVPEPFVGLLTGAWTEAATIGEEDGAGIRTLAVATIGLSNGSRRRADARERLDARHHQHGGRGGRRPRAVGPRQRDHHGHGGEDPPAP